MNDKIKFFLNFIKNPKQNASIIPSSSSLAKIMVQDIDFSKIKSVVELWPGTWVFTEEILRNKTEKCKFVAIEIEKTYVDVLEEKFWKRLIVEHNSVQNLQIIMQKNWIERPDVIISWLWFVSFPYHILKPTLESIMKYTDMWVEFRSFTYMPKKFKNCFYEFDTELIWKTLKNIPPAYVYRIISKKNEMI